MLMLSILHRTKRQALFYEMNVNSCISAKYWVVPFLPDSNKMKKKRLIMMLAVVAAASAAMAQGNGQAGITEATQMVTSYFDPGTKLIYAIGAVIGLVGGVKVYQKFSSGDPDTSKTASSWFGACIFLIVAATILRSFFL